MKLSRRLLALLFALSFGNPAAKGRTPIRNNKIVSVMVLIRAADGSPLPSVAIRGGALLRSRL